MRVLSRSLAIVAVLASSAIAAPTVYHDTTLGYSFTYDDSFVLTKNPKNTKDKSEWMLTSVLDHGNQWTFSLTVDPATTHPDTRLMAQAMAADLGRSIPGLKVVHDPKLFAPLNDTYTFDWTARDSTIHGAQYLYLCDRQQRMYVFTASSPDRMWKAYRPAWESVLSTFKFD